MAEALTGGALERQQLIDGGYTPTEVGAWENETRNTMLSGGFTPKEVDDYMGVRKPDTSLAEATILGNLDTVSTDDHARVASGWGEYLQAGWQMGAQALVQGKPTMTMPPDAGFIENLLSSVGTMAGDLPFMVAGGLAGAVVAAPTGPIGSVASAGAFGTAIPANIRATMMEIYADENGPKTPQEIWDMFVRIQYETARAFVAGGIGAAIGGAVGTKVTDATAPLLGEAGAKLTGTVANMTAFAGAAATVDAQMRGEVPTAEDFYAGAILALGMGVAGYAVGATGRFVPSKAGDTVAANLRDIYAKTGQNPQEVVNAARNDVVLQSEILGPYRADGTRDTPTVDAGRRAEPTPEFPYKPEINAANVEKTMTPPAEGAKPAPQYDPVITEKMPGYLNIFTKLEGSAAVAKQRGIDEARVVSSAGAIGRYQIMPGTARQYGFDAAKLYDPIYNETVAKAILADLHKRYNGDLAAMAVAYNAGPGKANIWIRGGRDMKLLPRETQKYLQHLDQLGALDGRYTWDRVDIQLRAAGDNGGWEPPPGGPPPRTGPEFTEPPPGGKKVTSDFGKLNEESLNDYFTSKIAPAQGTPPDYLSPRKLLAEFEFAASPARRIDMKIKSDQAEMTIEDTMRQTFASKERGGYMVRYGVIDAETLQQTSTANFMRAMEEVKKNGGTVQGFVNYRLAKRTVEKEAQGIKTGFDLKKAEMLLETPGVRKKYDQGLKTIQEMKDGAVNYLRDSGYVSPKQAQAMKDLNRYHIVMRRAMDPEYILPTGQGFTSRTIKRMKGSEKDVVDPLSADIDNTYTIAALADHNIFKGKLIDAILEHNRKANDPDSMIPFEKIGQRAIADDAKVGGTPPPAEGTVRLYRAETSDKSGKSGKVADWLKDSPEYKATVDATGRWFSDSIEAAKYYAEKFGNGEITYVDVPKAQYEKYRASEQPDRAAFSAAGRAKEEFFVPRDVADARKPFSEGTPKSGIKDGELLDADGHPLPAAVKEVLQDIVLTQKMYGNLKPGDILYRRDGVTEIWHTTDPDIAAIAQFSWPAKVNPWAMIGIKFAGMVRAGIVSSPDFMIRTTMQSSIGSAAMGKGAHPVPFVDMIHGAMEVFKAGEAYKRWVRNGGAGTSITDLDINYLRRDMERIFYKTGMAGSVWNVARHPLDALRTVMHMLDAAPRVGMMMRLEKKGVPTIKAATMGRKAHIDYGEGFKNQWIQTWSRMVAFMPSGFKDMQQFGQRVKENWKRVAIGGASFMTTFTIMNWLMNEANDRRIDEDRAKGIFSGEKKYEEYDRMVRDLYWLTPFEINGSRIKILRPFLPAVPFAMLPERFLDWAKTGDPHFLEWASDALAMTMTPLVPNVVIPIAENVFNVSTRGNLLPGGPLISETLEDAHGYMQYRTDTTETAKALTRLLGPANMNVADWSPITLDNYIRDWGGTVPMTFLRVIEDKTGAHNPGKPWETADLPFLGGLFARKPQGGVQVDDFYAKLKEITASKADLRLAIDRQNPLEIEEASSVEAFLKISPITLALTNMRNMIKVIELSDMTDAEKIKFTDQIGVGMVEVAKAGSLILDSLTQAR